MQQSETFRSQFTLTSFRTVIYVQHFFVTAIQLSAENDFLLSLCHLFNGNQT